MIFFVTGTDTDSGKTLVACALLQMANGKTLGLKPIASGCERVLVYDRSPCDKAPCDKAPDGLRNSDALALMKAASMQVAYNKVNPIAFEPAIAPHIAAMQAGQELTIESIMQQCDLDLAASADLCLIEGAGGWHLPLAQGQFLSQWVKQLKLPVILVVGMKLGCLNHAALTEQAILADGLNIAGWVASQIDPNMRCFNENLASLKQMMTGPFLGCIPYLIEATPANACQYLDIKALDIA